MTFCASTFLQNLEQETVRLSETLKAAKVACMEAGRPDIAEWIDLELDGYKGTGTLFAYRTMPGVVKSVVTKGEETLNDYVFRSIQLKVTSGINDLIHMPMLQEALRLERNFFVDSVDHDSYVFRRFLSAAKPGYVAQRAWSEYPIDHLPKMVQGIGERLEQVLANLHHKPSWW